MVYICWVRHTTRTNSIKEYRSSRSNMFLTDLNQYIYWILAKITTC